MTTPSAASLILGISEGQSVVLLPDGTKFADLAGLLAAVPALQDPAEAATLARCVNQFAQGGAYEVILDPAAFEAASRARLAKEDPNEPWREGVNRLGDFGVPDFAAITAPVRVGDGLRYFAVERVLGLPYRAETASLAVQAVYEPVHLTPLPAAGDAFSPGDATGPATAPAETRDGSPDVLEE